LSRHYRGDGETEVGARPYRPGLVLQAIWWFDVVFALPMGAMGVFTMVAGIGARELQLALFGAFFSVFSAVVGVGAWRLIHLGVWTGPVGVEVRSVMRPTQRFPWSAVDRFEVRPGQSVMPFIQPAPQVAVILHEDAPVLVSGLWLRSPFTWGGVGPTRIVTKLNEHRPEALAPS